MRKMLGVYKQEARLVLQRLRLFQLTKGNKRRHFAKLPSHVTLKGATEVGVLHRPAVSYLQHHCEKIVYRYVIVRNWCRN